MPSELKAMVAEVYGLFYGAPALMGYGDHWRLRKNEAEDLAEATIRCLDGSESDLAARVMEWLLAMMPVVTLCGLLIFITADRIKKTRELFAQQKERQTDVGNESERAEYRAGAQAEASEGNLG